jgi:hypothetical protein
MVAGLFGLLAGFLAAAPRAEAEEVRHPQRQLTFQEACALPHTRVELRPQIVRERLRRAFITLGDSPAQDAWDSIDVLKLARSYALGVSGRREPAEAARLYCLLLHRVSWEPAAAMLLAHHHAHAGEREPSPALARHFARVAAVQIGPQSWRRLLIIGFRRLIPRDGWIEDALARAHNWYHELKRAPAHVRFRTALQYLHGAGVPRSDRIALKLLGGLTQDTAFFSYFYAQRVLDAHPPLLAGDTYHAKKVRLALHRAVLQGSRAAMRLTSELYRDGRLLPLDRARATAWRAHAQGVGADAVLRGGGLDEAFQARVRALRDLPLIALAEPISASGGE